MCTLEYKCPQSAEASDPSGAAALSNWMAGDCQPVDKGAGS